MAMKAFDTVMLIGEGKVQATGPFVLEEGFELKRLSFMLSQKDVMVEGAGELAGDGHWQGVTDAGGLKAGEYVYAVGVATLAHDAWPPAVQNYTWCEQVHVKRVAKIPPASDQGDPG
jgi:hypothetical protein